MTSSTEYGPSVDVISGRASQPRQIEGFRGNHDKDYGRILDFMDNGNCLPVDPEICTPTIENAESVDKAKKVCDSCVAIIPCRIFGLKTKQSSGIWGGLSTSERKVILKRTADRNKK